MKKFALALFLAASPLAFAQDAGASVDFVDAGSSVGPIVVAPPKEAPKSTDSLNDPQAFAKIALNAAKEGNWSTAVAASLVLLISLLYLYGRKLHEMIPDDSWADKPFWFLLETKPGGWLMNFMFATGGGVGFSLIAGEPVSWAMIGTVIKVSFTAAGVAELGKDILAWWKERKSAPPAPAPTAK